MRKQSNLNKGTVREGQTWLESVPGDPDYHSPSELPFSRRPAECRKLHEWRIDINTMQIRNLGGTAMIRPMEYLFRGIFTLKKTKNSGSILPPRRKVREYVG